MGVRVAEWTRTLMSLVLVAGLLAATSGEAFGYRRSCSHHEAASLLAGNGSDDGGAPHHAGHGGDAGHADDAGTHDGPCSCLGNCTISTPSPGPDLPTIEVVLPAPVSSFRVRATAVVPAVQVRISHLIPFPNAPPLA